MSFLKLPSILMVRVCPNVLEKKCTKVVDTTTHGWAYPAGIDSKWKCYVCNYVGRPRYFKYRMILEELE